MFPKEIVYRAIEFKNPPRVPVVYFNRDFEKSDILASYYSPSEGYEPSEPGKTEWGYVWQTLDGTMGQPIGCPLADLSNLTCYAPPNPHAPGRLVHLNQFADENRDKFLLLGLGITGFDQAIFLRGLEDFLSDLYLDRAAAERILDIVFDFENGMIEQTTGHALDCIKFADDWGTQNGMIVSPDLWRDVFKPRYARQFELVHKAGKKVWFHTCGNVYPIIGDLIDVGVDVIELLQPDLLGIDNLARDFGGKVCFCCSVDHQRTALSGTRDEVFTYADKLISKLGSFGGGFIAYIEDYSCLGMSEQNYQWICEAFDFYGKAVHK
ncbi:MAG: uroporphyrinogen decarboxylase family protein [Armatimonadota bacterium]